MVAALKSLALSLGYMGHSYSGAFVLLGRAGERQAREPQLLVPARAELGQLRAPVGVWGTLSSGHRDWHEPGERLAALFLVNTRRGYFTRKQ